MRVLHSLLMKARMAGGGPAQGAARVAAAFQHAVVLQQQGRPFQADALCAQVLRADPDHAGAWHLRAMLAIEGGSLEQGIEWLRRSLKIQPQQPAAHSNLGNALLSLGRPEEALASFDAALRLKSDYVVALYNRGNALRELKRFEEALVSYDRALQLQPRQAPAHHNRGLVLLSLGRIEDAVTALQRALELDAGFKDAGENLATALCMRAASLIKLQRSGAALLDCDRALELSPGNVDVLINRASALGELERYEEAAECFAAALRSEPERDYVLGNLFHARLDVCDWRDYEVLVARLMAGLAANRKVVNPFTLLVLPSSPQVFLECTRAQSVTEHAAARSARVVEPRRVRVAYISPDFRDHPVSYLMIGVLERHDREKFEVIGVSLRKAQQTGIGERLHAAFDRFIEVEQRGDQQIAGMLREMEVDIAVDLAGLTDGLRVEIFAHRAAPVQVNYLGYPGTMGAPFIDYILADEFVIPPDSRQHYCEQVVYLPECFQANDDRCTVGPKPTRAEVGLPQKGLVLCCINNNYKLNPPLFEIWTRLLREAPGSVLWLLADRNSTQENLRREAAARGVSPERLVFAGRMPYAQHLGRLGLADLFLDTLPYNAGATASDALRTGVPVLTCAGEAFASRMAGSLLRAVGLAELITHSLEEYEHKALELLREPRALGALRARLAKNIEHAPLFDTARFCRHLESAFKTMHERAMRGERPEAFSVHPED
jgi:protein O-GlcNAc transferase